MWPVAARSVVLAEGETGHKRVSPLASTQREEPPPRAAAQGCQEGEPAPRATRWGPLTRGARTAETSVAAQALDDSRQYNFG